MLVLRSCLADVSPAESLVTASPPTVCGDLQCSQGETYKTCCTDCGCPIGHICVSNYCVREASRSSSTWEGNVWNVLVGLGLGVAAYLLALGVLKGVLPRE